jgi:hypothetical protein
MRKALDGEKGKGNSVLIPIWGLECHFDNACEVIFLLHSVEFELKRIAILFSVSCCVCVSAIDILMFGALHILSFYFMMSVPWTNSRSMPLDILYCTPIHRDLLHDTCPTPCENPDYLNTPRNEHFLPSFEFSQFIDIWGTPNGMMCVLNEINPLCTSCKLLTSVRIVRWRKTRCSCITCSQRCIILTITLFSSMNQH